MNIHNVCKERRTQHPPPRTAIRSLHTNQLHPTSSLSTSDVMPFYTWDRLGANMEVTNGIQISDPTDHQSADLHEVERTQSQAPPTRIPKCLLWSRFDAKLDHCNKVVQAREACLPQSGLSEATIHRVEHQNGPLLKSNAKADGKAATLRDRVTSVKEVINQDEMADMVAIEAAAATTLPADRSEQGIQGSDKRKTALAMREGIRQIKRADSVSRNTAYWQSRGQPVLGSPALVKTA